MDMRIADECMAMSLAGKITFPEVVMKLANAGVERYIVDLVGLQKSTYGNDGGAHHGSFSFDNAAGIANDFDAAGVRAAIHDIQQQKINYVEFLRRIMASGCSHYEVYINGKKAIYLGRDGSQHIELFPSGK